MKRCFAASRPPEIPERWFDQVSLYSLQFQSHLKGLINFTIIPLVFMQLTKRPRVASKVHNVFTRGKKTPEQTELYSHWIKA